MRFFITIYVMVSGFVSMALFDYLIYVQRRDHRDAWLRDGRPNGFIYTPFENGKSIAERMRYGRATGRIGRSMWFKTPEWISHSAPGVRAAYWAYRLIILSAFIVVAVYLIFSLMN